MPESCIDFSQHSLADMLHLYCHLQNAVLWLFLASLCFIFRMRDDNPYLMLDEEGETGGN